MAKVTYGHGSAPNVANVDANGQFSASPIFRDANGEEINIIEALKDIKKRLLILEPNFEAHERYPALKEAYEHYKLMEDLLLTGNEDEDDS